MKTLIISYSIMPFLLYLQNRHQSGALKKYGFIHYSSMSFFDMIGYVVMAPLLNYLGRNKALTGSFAITGATIIFSSLLQFFFSDNSFIGVLCQVLGE